jgi:hypothetical protein
MPCPLEAPTPRRPDLLVVQTGPSVNLRQKAQIAAYVTPRCKTVKFASKIFFTTH